MNYSSKKPQGLLKSIQYEHFSKLLSKQNNETELLEDLRSFCKQKAALDKEYGQSLQKICVSFLGKKEFLAVQNPPIESVSSNVWDVWKSFLRALSKLAASRLQSGKEHTRLSTTLKPLKVTRSSTSKRAFDQLKSLQNDLGASVQEMVKSHKMYAEEEKQAHEVREKARSAEEKLRRRSTNFFSSMAQLHRNHAKLSSRSSEFESRSNRARNEYLFQLTAINAHLNHYITKDVPDLAKTLDGDFYDKVRDVLTTTSQVELNIGRHHDESFKILLDEARQINRNLAWKQFVEESAIFSENFQFPFEPKEGDSIRNLLGLNHVDSGFEPIAKKLSRCFVIREKQLNNYTEELNNLRSGYLTPPLRSHASLKDFENNDEDNNLNQEYVEHKVEELEFAIRREDIEKTKIEACLNLLKQTSVDVDAALKEAYEVVKNSLPSVLPERKKCQLNQHISIYSSVGLSSNIATSSSTEGSTVGVESANKSMNYRSTEALKSGSLTSSDTPARSQTYNGGFDRTNKPQINNGEGYELELNDLNSTAYCEQAKNPDNLPRATALYEFLATRLDEIDLVVNENVVVLGSGDGEDWINVKSLLDGKQGLVPKNFLHFDDPGESTTFPDFLSTSPPSSCVLESKSPETLSVKLNQDSFRLIAGEQFVRSLISFTGSAADELSFLEGDLIRIVKQQATENVDDGWLKGELVFTPDRSRMESNTTHHKQGVFPSMLVKPISQVEVDTYREQFETNKMHPQDGTSEQPIGDDVKSTVIDPAEITASNIYSEHIKPIFPVDTPSNNTIGKKHYHSNRAIHRFSSRKTRSSSRPRSHSQTDNQRLQDQHQHRNYQKHHRRSHHTPSQHHHFDEFVAPALDQLGESEQRNPKPISDAEDSAIADWSQTATRSSSITGDLDFRIAEV